MFDSLATHATPSDALVGARIVTLYANRPIRTILHADIVKRRNTRPQVVYTLIDTQGHVSTITKRQLRRLAARGDVALSGGYVAGNEGSDS